ncbi:MAG: crossover junction endodeoxyribonuclease RuvC [Muribaculaceae bacterium]|nr:crossover junction endodeoxyribonuclease RuvC [Muribaculaceae bacterium]
MKLDGYDRIIIGIDPGTIVMGYAILGIKGKKPQCVAMGVVKLEKFASHYIRLLRIHQQVTSLIAQYLPDEMAIEAPYYGKNVQAMLKLGRAQGVAIAAALGRDVPIAEYEPRKIKQSVTGNGAASKEQLREMLRRILNIPDEQITPELDATDALGAALCHFYESSRPVGGNGGAKSWKDFINQNPDRVVNTKNKA